MDAGELSSPTPLWAAQGTSLSSTNPRYRANRPGRWRAYHALLAPSRVRCGRVASICLYHVMGLDRSSTNPARCGDAGHSLVDPLPTGDTPGHYTADLRSGSGPPGARSITIIRRPAPAQLVFAPPTCKVRAYR